MTINFQLCDRVRLTELGVSRCPKIKARTGVVTGFPREGVARVSVLFDGNKRPTTVHRSYLELDDAFQTHRQ